MDFNTQNFINARSSLRMNESNKNNKKNDDV